MNIYVDENKLESTSQFEEDMKAIFEQITSENKVIIHIYNEVKEFKSLEQAFADGKDFHVVTAGVSDYLLETVENVSSYLQKMIAAIEQTVEDFRTGEEGEGSKKFLDAIDGLGWLLDMAASQQNYIKQNKIKEPENVLFIEQYEELLAKIVEAWELNDFVLIADLLEYELIPWFEEYKEWGSKLQKGLSVDVSFRKH